MSYKQMERRLSELEQQQAGPQKIVFVCTTHDGNSTGRELTAEEGAARLAAAHAAVGPDGLVVRWDYGADRLEEVHREL